jgi:hypothetical protein
LVWCIFPYPEAVPILLAMNCCNDLQLTLSMIFLRVKTKSCLTRGKRSKILLKSSWEEQSELVKMKMWNLLNMLSGSGIHNDASCM